MRTRDAYIDQLRDWQWDAHLQASQKIAQEHQHKILKRKVKTFNDSNRRLQGDVLNRNATDIARRVMGNNNVVSRQRETASMWRRALAVILDYMFIITMITFNAYFAYLHGFNIFPSFVGLPSLMNKVSQMNLEFQGGVDTFINQLEKSPLNSEMNAVLDTLDEDLLIFTFCFKLMLLFYETSFLWLTGTTFGKWAMSIEVISYGGLSRGDNINVMVVDRSKISLVRAFVRTAAKMLYFTIIFPVVLFFVPLTRQGMTPYDRLTSTMVVHKLRDR